MKDPRFDEYYKMFSIESVYNKITHLTNCVSSAIFYHSYDKEIMDKCDTSSRAAFWKYVEENNPKWKTKYYDSFINILTRFNKDRKFQHYKYRIYVEKKLSFLVTDFLQCCPRIEVYVTGVNTDRSQPGMWWRYASVDDTSLDFVFVSDIDVSYNEFSHYLRLYERSSHPMMRFMANASCSCAIQWGTPALNYAVCLGSRIGFRPKLQPEPITKLMTAYCIHRDDRLKTSRPTEDFDDDSIDTSVYNGKVYDITWTSGEYPLQYFGWGANWKDYGADEKFLKHVLFPYFVKRGEMHTIHNSPIQHYSPSSKCIDAFKIDLAFCRQFSGNTFQQG